MSLIDNFIGIIAPHKCFLCQEEGAVLCKSCGLSLPTLPSICYACGKATHNFSPCLKHSGTKKPFRVYIFSEYKTDIKKLLHKYKFEYKRAAAKDIAVLIDSYLPYFTDSPLITYVPTIGKNVRERSFDHSKQIVVELAKIRGWNYAPLLVKTKNIRQIGSGRTERKKQLAGVIRVINNDLVAGQRILLVDDVITTGATIEACTAALLKAGASQVEVAVLARTPEFRV